MEGRYLGSTKNADKISIICLRENTQVSKDVLECSSGKKLETLYWKFVHGSTVSLLYSSNTCKEDAQSSA